MQNSCKNNIFRVMFWYFRNNEKYDCLLRSSSCSALTRSFSYCVLQGIRMKYCISTVRNSFFPTLFSYIIFMVHEILLPSDHKRKSASDMVCPVDANLGQKSATLFCHCVYETRVRICKMVLENLRILKASKYGDGAINTSMTQSGRCRSCMYLQ